LTFFRYLFKITDIIFQEKGFQVVQKQSEQKRIHIFPLFHPYLKMFCSFVNFKSAFDTVWRLGLWQKLQKSNIQGNIFKVIYNMYKNIKTCIRKGE
jgi:hypothetical protein